MEPKFEKVKEEPRFPGMKISLYSGIITWKWEEFTVIEDRRGGMNAHTIWTLYCGEDELYKFDSDFDRSGFKKGIIAAIQKHRSER